MRYYLLNLYLGRVLIAVLADAVCFVAAAVLSWFVLEPDFPVAEYALVAASAPLAPNLERGIVRDKVGPLETEFDRSSPEYTRYRAMDMMLAPYLMGGGANIQLVRS